MSAESNALKTLKALAQQYKPLIDALPELEGIVSLQHRAEDAGHPPVAVKLTSQHVKAL